MSSKRDQIWEQKKKERDEKLRNNYHAQQQIEVNKLGQREGNSGGILPHQPYQNFNNNYSQPPMQNNGFSQIRQGDIFSSNRQIGIPSNNKIDYSFTPQPQFRKTTYKQHDLNQNFPSQPQLFQNLSPQPFGFATQSQGFQSQIQGYSPQIQGSLPQNPKQEPIFRIKKQIIQNQVGNQPIQGQNFNIQPNGKPQINIETLAQIDQRAQKQQYGNILQQQIICMIEINLCNQYEQMIEKQQQLDLEKQQKQMDRQRMENERQRMQMQKLQDQEKERKEQYRLQLQEQMNQKELQIQQQQQQGFSGAQQYNKQPQQQVHRQQSNVGFVPQTGERDYNQNFVQGNGQILNNQMHGRYQNLNQEIDKKGIPQQQMQVQSSMPQQKRIQLLGAGNKSNIIRKNNNHMIIQAVSQGGINIQGNIPQHGVINQSNIIQSNQTTPQIPINFNQSQVQYSQTPQYQIDNQSQDQFNHQYQHQSQIIGSAFKNPQNLQKFNNSQLSQESYDKNQMSLVRGNRNFMKLENSDLDEVNKKQQQKSEYQRDLEKQIQEKKRLKEQEYEKERRQEFLEEKRILKDQDQQRRQLEEENNPKQQQDNVQKENEQIVDKKQNIKKQNGKLENGNNKNNIYNENIQSPINDVSREFLNQEKKNEGLDPRASLMDIHRSKSTKSENIQQSKFKSPAANVESSDQSPKNSDQRQQHVQQLINQMSMVQQPINPTIQQNGAMNGNQFMMGQYPISYPPIDPMMMNPQVIQQQQLLAKQQAEIPLLLNELKLQMQQQQIQMQQQMDLIKNQANIAQEERKKAEQKIEELNKQYEEKLQEEQKYKSQLQQALAKYVPQSNPSNQQNKNSEFEYQNQVNSIESKKEINQPSQNVIKYPNSRKMVQNKQSKDFNNQQNDIFDQNFNQIKFDDKHLQDNSKQEKQNRMQQQYGIKSLASDNKFIPLEVIDQTKDQQITLSKLANYGISGSQIKTQNNNIEQNSGYEFDQNPSLNHKTSNNIENKNQYYKNENLPTDNDHLGIDIKKQNNLIDQFITQQSFFNPSQGNSNLSNENNNNDIDIQKQNNLMEQFITQQSFYKSPINLKDRQKNNNENKFDMNAYDEINEINANSNIFTEKPQIRQSSNQNLRKPVKDQNPFGNAARGILGDSKAFENQKLNQIQQSNTFKSNADQEGINLGSDFPNISINSKNGFNAFGQKNKQPIQINDSEFNFQNSKLLKDKDYNTYNSAYNSNNFDIEKINKKNDERLNILDKFNIPTLNNGQDKKDMTLKEEENEDDLKRLDDFLLRFNKNNNVK